MAKMSKSDAEQKFRNDAFRRMEEEALEKDAPPPGQELTENRVMNAHRTLMGLRRAVLLLGKVVNRRETVSISCDMEGINLVEGSMSIRREIIQATARKAMERVKYHSFWCKQYFGAVPEDVRIELLRLADDYDALYGEGHE